MTPDYTSIAWWASQLGFPGVLCFMAWRILVFFKPYVIELIPILKDTVIKHSKLVDTLEANVGTVSESIKSIKDTQDEHGTMIKNMHNKLINN